jgi:predicted DCC family thiol-disulfide oxidoreductase YuxK
MSQGAFFRLLISVFTEMNDTTWPLTLYFDAACPMCRTEMASLRARDARGRLRFEDVRAPGFVPPAGATVAAMLEAIHGRTADGRIVAGVETLRLAYAAVGLGWLAAPTAWPLLRGPSERAYRWIARHRYALPAWLGRVGTALLAPRRAAIERAASAAAARARCNDSTCNRPERT